MPAWWVMPAPLIAIYNLWGIWAVSWGLAAIWSRRTERRPGFGSELLYRAVTVVGVWMLFIPVPHEKSAPLWQTPDAIGWLLVALAAAGFAFAWWARIHLGSLWSGVVTKKKDHRVVDTGPYRLVRHPIYTGIIFSSFALAAEKGTALALAGATIMLLGWYIKARLEERFLKQELGKDAYDAYAAHVPMLIPFAKI